MAAMVKGCRVLERVPFLARNLSVSSARHAELAAKPPIQVFGIEGRYAHAMYSAAAKQKSLEKVESELSKVDDLIRTNEKLSEYLVNPTLNKFTKQSLLTDVLKSLNYSDLTVNLFGTMAENNRLRLVHNVVAAFGKLMSAARGEVLCSITSAKELDASQLKELQTAMKGFVKPTETLKIETKVDPVLIGGMVIEIGDKRIDMSMATKIKNITNVLRESV
ncbi:ATP synthase subunit O, mitochondrial [Desmophyllum pertusum]|uniref:ATP synthase peripheral stalk subunit OSCP, mitochondrial n=1 Tax=Desmophyllum pertusum TaxID=174260 RepID=A0A9X0A6F7_9CNID|nr:ATP synthase subunit O, mitochondrial [Desmophyllum pertusum]